MADKLVRIIVKTIDQSTQQLKQVERGLKDTARAIKDTDKDFVGFNRTMFTATAFLGLFQKAFSGLTGTLSRGAELGRISDNFERVMGRDGTLLAALNDFKTTSIDRIEAMRSAIAIKTLGIARNTEEIAELIRNAGIAAKLAGYTSEEGIRRVTQSLKDGSLSSLEFLNLIRSNHPALKALFSVIQHGTGVMGGAISAQMRYNLIFNALAGVAKQAQGITRDLQDELLDLKQGSIFLRAELGLLLGKALTPIINSMAKLSFGVSDLFKRFRELSPGLVTTLKNIVLISSVVSGLFLSFGLFRFILLGLSKIGLGGLPLFATLLLSVATAFSDVDSILGKIINTFKIMGASGLAVFQLMASFINDANNFAEGIGKMDKKLYEFLSNYPRLLKFLVQTARFASVIILYIRDVGNTLSSFISGITTGIEKVIQSISDLFGYNPKGWSRSLIDENNKLRRSLVEIGAVITGVFLAIKGLGILKGTLAKIPFIGKFFLGREQKGPSGTANDPIYVRDADTIQKTITTGLLGGIGGLKSLGNVFKDIFKGPLSETIKGMFGGLLGGGLLGLTKLFTPIMATYAAWKGGEFIGNLLIKADKVFFDDSVGKAVDDFLYRVFRSREEKKQKEFIDYTTSPTFIKMLSNLRYRMGIPVTNIQFKPFADFLRAFPTPELGIEDLQERLAILGKPEIAMKAIPAYPGERFQAEISDIIKMKIQEIESFGFQTQVESMTAAFRKAQEQTKTEEAGFISREEWIEIFAAGINKSNAAKEQKPAHTSPTFRGC